MPKRNKKVEINIKADGKNWKWNEHGHNHGPWYWHRSRGAGGIYGLGFIGAAIYYLQTSTGFWQGVLGVLKAIAWPAFVVYKLLGL
jgi:hypothetical protein